MKLEAATGREIIADTNWNIDKQFEFYTLKVPKGFDIKQIKVIKICCSVFKKINSLAHFCVSKF